MRPVASVLVTLVGAEGRPFGIICLVVGVVGALEVARGRPFSGIFGTLAPGGRRVSQARSIDVRAAARRSLLSPPLTVPAWAPRCRRSPGAPV